MKLITATTKFMQEKEEGMLGLKALPAMEEEALTQLISGVRLSPDDWAALEPVERLAYTRAGKRLLDFKARQLYSSLIEGGVSG